jgi:hypothetical protein
MALTNEQRAGYLDALRSSYVAEPETCNASGPLPTPPTATVGSAEPEGAGCESAATTG